MASRPTLLALLLLIFILAGSALGAYGFFFVGLATYDLLLKSSYSGWEALGPLLLVVGISILIGAIVGGIAGNKLGKYTLTKFQVDATQIPRSARYLAILSLVVLGALIYSFFYIGG